MIRVVFDKLSAEAQSAMLFSEAVSKYKPISKEYLTEMLEEEKLLCERVIKNHCCSEHCATALTRHNELCNLIDFISKFTVITSDN